MKIELSSFWKRSIVFFMAGAICGFFYIIGQGTAPPIPSNTDKIIKACNKLGGTYMADDAPTCMTPGTGARFIKPEDLTP